MLRPAIDLSLLNRYIKKQPFKMEAVKSVRHSIVNNDWAVSIDWTDAYLHVPIHPQSRKYLRFVHENQIFQFTALPFRMSLSPWIFTKLMDVVASHLRQRAISVFSVPRRLADKKSDSQSITVSDKILPSSSSESGFYSKPKKVGINTCSDFHVHRHGISDTAEFSQGPSGTGQDSNIDYQNNSLMQSSIGTNFPFSFGQTQCSSRFHSPWQTSLTTPANVSLFCLETSHFAPRSSNHDQQYDTISFKMVDGHQSFHNRNSYPSPGTQCIPLYGRQSSWMGSSFRADETIL